MCPDMPTNSLEDADTMPLSLGVAMKDGRILYGLVRGTVLPCASLLTLDVEKGETGEYPIRLFQGLGERAIDGLWLATTFVKARLDSPPLLRVLVVLNIDVNGVLHVDVFDPAHRRIPFDARTERSAGLSEAEIQRLVERYDGGCVGTAG